MSKLLIAFRSCVKLIRTVFGLTDRERDGEIKASDDRITRSFVEAHSVLSDPNTTESEIDAATVQLNDISVKCLQKGLGPPLIPLLMVCVLALAGGGCNPKSTVFEEDLTVLDMTRQIVERQAVEITKLEAELAQLTPAVLARLLPLAGNLKVLNGEAAANVLQLQDNWGAPGVAKIYSVEANADARKASKDKHNDAWTLAKIAGGILTGATVVVALLRSPAAKLVPFVGQIVAAIDPMLAGIEKFMADQKARGKGETAVDLAESLAGEQKVAKVDKFVKKRLVKVKKKIAPALQAIADLTPGPDSETKVITPTT